MKNIISGKRIFDGSDWLDNVSIVYGEGKIIDVLPTSSINENELVPGNSFPVVAPALIDIQIYGAGGSLFSQETNANTLQKMYDRCVEGGTHLFLPTIATNEPEILSLAIDAIREYWQHDGKGVVGLHVEGPWLNKIKRGAHLEKFVHSPDEKEIRELLAYGREVIKIITLAPEVCEPALIKLIQEEGVVVSAGHSNMTFEQAISAFEKGIDLTTHLFNAMSPIHHRNPGFPTAVMLTEGVRSSIVPDGHHVDFNMIRLAKKLMGDRLFIITDAVTETSAGPYQHKLSGAKYVTGDVLSGSDLTMLKGVQNCTHECDIPAGEAINMASLYPAKVLGISEQYGRIKKGYNSDLICLDEDLSLEKNIFS